MKRKKLSCPVVARQKVKKMEYKTNKQRTAQTEVVSKERVSVDRIGCLWLTRWHFRKNRIYKDGDGEVALEQPFEENVFSLGKFRFNKWSSIWLTEDEVRDLANMIESQQRLG